MRSQIKNLPNSKIELLIELLAEEFDNFYRKANFDLKEAANLAVREKYPQIILEKNIEAIGKPNVEILKLAKDNPFSFKIQVDILPKIILPDYKNIAQQVKKQETKIIEGKIEDKEVEETLSWLLKSRAKFIAINEPAKFNDFIEIEYNSSQIENGKIYQDGFILGEGHFLPGFEKNLEGMKAGEEKEFPIEKFNFKVKLKSNFKMELPELNDEFAKSIGNFNNLATLKESIKKGIKMEKNIAETQRKRNEILEKIAKETNFEIPGILVESQKNELLEDLKQKISSEIKIPYDKYLSQIQKTEEDLKNSFSELAKKMVKNFLILREIGKKENIKVNEEEIKNEINKTIKSLPKEKIKELDLERFKEYYRSVIYNEKVFQLLESFFT
ncbi:trigger factor [bacterium (Candidatus Gribaldobacteria) CG07_land_8_20_14_0_80_33_18]|uniref:Trigger factor n=1 Tax=bacterium (Candidatus Gribaldobacteria) CG07_land_8_20_14_0_80_33_18 TaxID=2014272 RepID=A0A2M6Z264_9BACT|nr:MAG: trigger factor [bacterium (Candidatus Gribaldobacteria) CG10_big_fil_rev_8_21_14_0_10_33_41]PIU46490.1 MAG: trigger factor [bacterium (Candidatus Gribaldobacteria) CG07_land_8_20_14_0_80_33_18]PJA00869.1 MAG: trigger factor [bacterium (Candidatus Gribaldobacteria) CG_4_10_14_0_2_um_filter_33_15]PJB08760.1 MAG: trigger factor [bacterium (Candidatus Gribaldobacteria) CG_4_9_14_3_um_filter_33_9]